MSPKTNASKTRATRNARPTQNDRLGDIGFANLQEARSKLNAKLDQNPSAVWQSLVMLDNGSFDKISEAKKEPTENTLARHQCETSIDP